MKKTIITLAVFAISLSTYAQSELSGFWTFENQESISGKLYGNGSPNTVKMSVDGNNITVEKSTAVGDGAFTKISETINTDGKTLETLTASKRKKVITLTKDGGKYTELVILYNAVEPSKIDHRVTDTWYIVDGILVLDRKDENRVNGEIWESKAFYRKN